MTKWHYNQTQTLLILTPLVALFALGLDVYIPIVPDLATAFNQPHSLMQLTLSGYMLTCALGQILAGPLCDQIGRRKVAIYSLSIFIIGCIIGIYTHNLLTLILARILQSIGASGTFLCAYATVRDLYPKPEDSAAIYSYINVCISQSPIFAPSLGAYIALNYDWHAVFALLLIIGALTLILTTLSYQDTTPEYVEPNLRRILASYNTVVTHPGFLAYTASAACGMATFFMFFSQSPYIIMNILGYSKNQFGIFFGLVGFSFFLASLFTPKACKKLGVHACVELGCSAMNVGAVSLIIGYQLYGTTIIGFIGPIAIAIIGAALTIGAGMAGTMEPFGKIAGTAFSAVGFCKFFLSASLGLLLMQFDTTPQILGLIILITATLSQAVCFYYRDTLCQYRLTYTPTEYE
ncbi:multidrug effflux MFS transporter [Candidatus Comchoanobacter bicostacola]|uniref:Bcr/CflA family efflux transporter n=1 Tax=Candidatus Comchoanobacter bicostacola TaxID=2919598 RepID=A0ABY5DKF8_9GAMM|nr:multidrug effflux MFS transporter [Candidatus Comchoanobacter bicostacola]UTC24369.1 multidrug effflux MFS transporter [Candidatus Comchoanobacter bicostacola]